MKIYNYNESEKTILIFNSYFTKLTVMRYCKIWKFTIVIYSCIKLCSRCFWNPVYSASLCLMPHLIAVFVRYKMCLVAQFGKWHLLLLFFFSRPTLLTSASGKKVILEFHVFKKLAFSFTC